MSDTRSLRSSATEAECVTSALGKFRTFGHGAAITPAEGAAMAAYIDRLEAKLEFYVGLETVALSGTIS